MNRQTWFTSLIPLFSSLLAILAAFLVGALFLRLTGKNPGEAYALLFGRGMTSSFGVTESLIKMAPLLLVSAGLLIALKAGVWNIGIDGQFLFGAVLVGIVAPKLAGTMPFALMLIISGFVGFLGGVVWGIIPALLKIRYGLNEIITTIMMNFVAIYVTSWFVKGPFKDPSVVPPQTVKIPQEFRLPALPFTRVHVGLIVGLLAVILVYLLFRNTTLGFKFTVLGRNKGAAIHSGMSVNWLVMLALLLSAGFAGLAGANDVLGVKGLFQGEWNPAYGFTGFALVFLARLNGLMVIPFAYFFAALLFSGELMARTAGIPAFFVQILEGLMLVFVAVGAYLEREWLARRSGLR